MKRRKFWLCIMCSLLIFIVNSAAVYAEEIDGEDDGMTLAPYFIVEGAASTEEQFPLKETKVSTNINGVIAETYVTQTYTNEGQNPINASYVFPTSTRVTIHGMKIEIGDKVVIATIKEREEAKQEFEEAESEGKSAALLEEQRPNVFTMDVANIMPGDIVNIELHYTELIVSTDGIYQFVFPTVVGPRYASPSEDMNTDTDQWVETPYLKDGNTPPGKYDINVNLSTGVPITDLTCKSHKINVAKDGESVAKVTLANPEEFAGNRDFILDYKLTGQDVSTGLMLDTGEKEKFFMLMVQPPERYKPEEIPPREYIFVLDVSGSMEGYPLDTAKQVIRDLVSNLRETDSFNLILFSGASFQMSPVSIPATAVNIKNAIDLIDQQDGGGGTELAPALEDAINIPMDENVSRSIVVFTDGYISGETDIFNIISKNIGTTNFFSFGIGSSVNRYLIDGIAKAGLGEAFVVTDAADAADTAERFRTYIQSPILTDIKVEYDNFDAYDIEPNNIPTLFAQRPIVLFGKWRGEPNGTIRITGKTGNKDYVQEIKISEVKQLEANNAIRYLWARTKVERLTDYGLNENQDAAKKEVTEIGLNYTMITPYTSFIAVIDTVRNTDGNSTDVDQPLPLPENVSNLAVGYTTGSEPEGMILISMVIFLMALSFLYRVKNKKLLAARGSNDDLQ